MSNEENKALAHRLCTAFNTVFDGRTPEALTEQDLAIFNEFMTPDLASSTKSQMIPGAYGLWGDHHLEITDMIAEGDNVWAQVTSGGRPHRGMERHPTHRQTLDKHRRPLHTHCQRQD